MKVRLSYNEVFKQIDDMLLSNLDKSTIWCQYTNILHSANWSSFDFEQVTQSLVDLEWSNIHKNTLRRFN